MRLPSTLLKMTENVTHDLFDSYLRFEKPLFAAVNGPAVGGGCTSLLHFDVVIASSRATFLTPFKSLGLPKLQYVARLICLSSDNEMKLHCT